jgi:hypothetical protein
MPTGLRTSALIALALVSCTDEDRTRRPRIGKSIPAPEDVVTSSSTTVQDSPPPASRVTLSELVEGGQHTRLSTKHGAIHVWTPKGYDARRAETILYVHGYYVDVDQAWRNYNLETQFAASAINAIFIACEAPRSAQEPVSWSSLADLLDTVETGLAARLPRRRIVAMGHSGAHRTLRAWLDDPMIDTVVLVDAAYGEIEEYKKWILASDRRRLINVGDNTRAWTDKLHAQLPDTVVLNEFPTVEDGIPRDIARARILYIKSNLGHMPLVTNGFALPMILRTLRAKRLVHEPLSEILGS